MPTVNFVNEQKAFMEYAADNGLSGNEMLVWMALFHLMNRKASGAEFPDGFIAARNDRLLFYAPMSYDSLAKARNRLSQRGLIEYIPGKWSNDAPRYRIRFLTAPDEPKPQTDGDKRGENEGKKEAYNGHCHATADSAPYSVTDSAPYSVTDSAPHSKPDIYQTYNRKPNEE